MAYFRNHEQQPRQPLFEQPVQEQYEDYEDQPYYDDDYDEPMTREERRHARRLRFRVMAGLLDFLGVIAGMVVILVVIALLVSLVTWLQSDIYQTFTLLTTNF